MQDRFEFEVEYIFKSKPTVIFARKITAGGFALDEASTFHGCLVRPHASMPSALDAHGKRRVDMFAFTLRDGNDRTKFVRGQVVELVATRTSDATS